MKSRKVIIGIVLVTIILVACGSKKVLYKEGVYEGIGEAYHGTIKVVVTTSKYKITDIEVIDDEPVPIVSEAVYKEIPKRVIKKNSTEVDTVAGATSTSEGLLQAIESALKESRVEE